MADVIARRPFRFTNKGLAPSGKSGSHFLASRLGKRGASRSSRHAGGMRWTRRVAVHLWCTDERQGADGEIVWSWHPGADAKPACGERAGDGGNQPIPGEITYKR